MKSAPDTDPEIAQGPGGSEELATLATNPLLSLLSAQDVAVFFAFLDSVALERGTVVLREGEVSEHMYFVLSGTVSLDRGGVALHPLGPGDHFGELGLVGGNVRAATAVAATGVRLARLSRDGYARLVEAHPQLAVRVLQALVRTLGDTLAAMTDNVGQLLRLRSVPRSTEVAVRLSSGAGATVRTGTPLRALLPQQIDGALVVAGMIDAKPVSLDTPLLSDVAIEPLTLASPEGRIVLRRAAGLLLLEAARIAAPDVTVRVGPSLGPAQVVRVEPRRRAPEILGDVTREMARLVEHDAPFREELWSVQEARAELCAQGQSDAASLLVTRRSATVKLQSAGDLYALEVGPLPPSAGVLRGLSLSLHPEGFLLEFGDSLRRSFAPEKGLAPVEAELERAAPRFGGEMVEEHRAWLSGLGVTSVGELNDLCISGQVAQLIRVSEGFHEKRIGRIADLIAKVKDTVRILAVAGPSSSGKTTFIKRLKVQLEINGLRPVGLSLDDYYRDRDDTPLDEDGQRDYEAFEALQVPLLHEHLRRMLAGETVATARFDFVQGKSNPEGGPRVKIEPRDVLMLEGIHGLNPQLLGDGIAREQAFRIFVHPATTLSFDRLTPVAPADVRLLRRIVRDRHGRGAKAADNILRWPSVRRGERVHIYPCLPNADAVFDTSLIYELSVLKVYADRYLLEVPEGHPAFPTAFRLRRVIDRFVTIYPDHVPPTSLLREFIGGSGFEY